MLGNDMREGNVVYLLFVWCTSYMACGVLLEVAWPNEDQGFIAFIELLGLMAEI
jgi:hypothetical protein